MLVPWRVIINQPFSNFKKMISLSFSPLNLGWMWGELFLEAGGKGDLFIRNMKFKMDV